MVEKLSTGFEEQGLLSIKCEFCNDTGAVKEGDKYIDCPKCIHKRIEMKTQLRNNPPKPDKPTIIATTKGPRKVKK